ncbi:MULTISPECIES: ATP-binding protein [unclassified Streptomyces]|uniref:ATP-binding protein n=1 Tax=unclassified Streptomyces TaxID=2593676 RepID=UPI00203381D3|nr:MULTISPECIES: ATP-binding protein [unclassified Streptomyces]MCM2420529.1 ATP-binding protein [Streptomyces sp. RKAG293]MCM2427256.1 ATP-binding protein [Streptomyces sp. RKAG337]
MRTEAATVLEPLWDGVLAPGGLAASSGATCELPGRFEAVRDARRFTRATLQRWDLAPLFDSIELVASELVTNALRYAVPPGTGGAPVHLSLVRWTSRVVCAVRDPSAIGPVARTPDFVAESGRGLHLVESYSETWGWHPLTGAGKVVWALFHSPIGMDEDPSL